MFIEPARDEPHRRPALDREDRQRAHEHYLQAVAAKDQDQRQEHVDRHQDQRLSHGGELDDRKLRGLCLESLGEHAADTHDIGHGLHRLLKLAPVGSEDLLRLNRARLRALERQAGQGILAVGGGERGKDVRHRGRQTRQRRRTRETRHACAQPVD